jgi:hypothetical protein
MDGWMDEVMHACMGVVIRLDRLINVSRKGADRYIQRQRRAGWEEDDDE